MSDLPIAPEDYGRFIGQIELRNIWLSDASLRNEYGPRVPDQIAVNIGSTASWSSSDEGFVAAHHYAVAFESPDETIAEIAVTFSVEFESAEPMTEEIFSVFQDVNLPVNTWPYLREFLASTLGRMNWLPFTLPAFKRRTEPDPASSESTPRPKRSRRKSASTNESEGG